MGAGPQCAASARVLFTGTTLRGKNKEGRTRHQPASMWFWRGCTSCGGRTATLPKSCALRRLNSNNQNVAKIHASARALHSEHYHLYTASTTVMKCVCVWANEPGGTSSHHEQVQVPCHEPNLAMVPLSLQICSTSISRSGVASMQHTGRGSLQAEPRFRDECISASAARFQQHYLAPPRAVARLSLFSWGCPSW